MLTKTRESKSCNSSRVLKFSFQDGMLLCGLTKWQRNNCKEMREIQWAQVTVSKQYREHAFRKPRSTTMDGGWIKGSFDPWQRSLFVPPVSSANTKEKGPLLAGKINSQRFFQIYQTPLRIEKKHWASWDGYTLLHCVWRLLPIKILTVSFSLPVILAFYRLTL